MKKKLKYIIISWFFVLITFVVERYYLHNYIEVNKIIRYAEKSGNILAEVDQKISDMAATGQFNYLIWIEGHISDELWRVKSIHPLIRDVLIFSNENHLLAGTSDRFSNSDFTPLLEKAGRDKAKTFDLRKEGYVQVYPVINGDNQIKGYIAVVLNVPAYLNEGSVFVMNVTKGNLFWNNPGYINDADAAKMRDQLQITKMDRAGSRELTLSKSHEIFWSYYQPRNVYFGYVRDSMDIFEYVYFYVLIICVLVNLILVFTGKSRKTEKFEVYEKIIHNNIQTLTEMKKGIESIILDNTKPTILEIEAVVSQPMEENTQLISAFYHKPERDGGEIAISDFILLDPFDTKWYKPLKRKSKLPDVEKASRLSRAAFTPELLNLMEEISKKEQPDLTDKETSDLPDQETGIPAKDSDTPETHRSIHKDPFAMALEQLYSVDEPGEELDIVLENIRTIGKADGLAIMFFDKNIACYTIEISAGLDLTWSRHFYLLSADSILNSQESKNSNIIVSEDLMQNSFFRKRIPPDYLNRLGAIKIITVQTKEIPIRAVLFYYRDGDFFQENRNSITEALGRIDTIGYSRLFNEILPVLNKIYIKKEKENIHPGESYRDIYNTLKSFTILSDKKIQIVHALLSREFDSDFRAKLQAQCTSNFKNYERYIVNNPTHLIFLLNETDSSYIEKIVLELDAGAQLKILNYPDLGKNLFAYL